MYCQHCGVVVDLPFRCSFCGGYFCAEHRLPENHMCPEYLKVIIRQRESSQLTTEETIPKEQYSYGYEKPKIRIESRWSSSTEIIHLIIGAILVLVVGLSIPVHQKKIDLVSPLEIVFLVLHEPVILFSSALVFTSVFIPHELSHKAVAKHYGLWAEFRLTIFGVLLTLLSVISPIKFVSPGAVMIVGEANRKIIGRTAFAGPLINIVLSSLFLSLFFLVPLELLSSILMWGAALSAWISLFNLIPFSVFDGAKVFWWSKPIWIISFIASLILTIVTFILL